MDPTIVEYLLAKCFPGLQWASVTADPKFNSLKRSVKSLNDLEGVMLYGSCILPEEDELLTPLKFQ